MYRAGKPTSHIEAEIAAIHQTDEGFIADGRYFVDGEGWQEPIIREITDQEAQALATALGYDTDFLEKWREFTTIASVYVLGGDSGFGEFEAVTD